MKTHPYCWETIANAPSSKLLIHIQAGCVTSISMRLSTFLNAFLVPWSPIGSFVLKSRSKGRDRSVRNLSWYQRPTPLKAWKLLVDIDHHRSERYNACNGEHTEGHMYWPLAPITWSGILSCARMRNNVAHDWCRHVFPPSGTPLTEFSDSVLKNFFLGNRSFLRRWTQSFTSDSSTTGPFLSILWITQRLWSWSSFVPFPFHHYT